MPNQSATLLALVQFLSLYENSQSNDQARLCSDRIVSPRPRA